MLPSQYGYEMLEPNGNDLYYLLTHRVLAYIYGYEDWDKNLPSSDWKNAIIELANAINKAPSVPVNTELYVMDLGSSYQQVILQRDVIQIQLQKTSSDTSITEGNSCYSLEGAEYSIYLDQACTEYFGKIVTDENGFAKYGNKIPEQNYYIKETKAPQGYALDKTVYPLSSATSKKENGITVYTFNVEDKPLNDPINILLSKVDAATGETGAYLANAEFTIKYYDGYYSTSDELKSKTPIKSWTMKTDEDGYISLSPYYLVDGDEFYYNEFNQVTIPLGTITIQETKAPDGYKINPEVFIRQIKTDSVAGIVTTYNPPTIEEEQVAKGKVQIIKTDSLTDKPLKGVQFGLYSSNQTDSSGLLLQRNLIETLTTLADGTAVSSELEKGTYYIQEIKALNYYQFDKTVYPATISENLTTQEIKIVNHVQTGKVKVEKTSEDGVIEGIVFRLQGATFTGQYIERLATTNAEGIADFGEVPVGSYSIVEVTQELRYVTSTYKSTVVTNGSDTTITFHNSLKKSPIQIVKTSEDDVVKDIYFNISSSNGSHGNYKTDAGGNIYLGAGLPVYDSNNEKVVYTITELGFLNGGTYTIPNRYNPPSPKTATLEYGKTTVVRFENTLKTGTVTLNKTDASLKVLTGAEFKLYHADGTEVKTIQNGNGTYMYNETSGATRTLTPSSDTARLYISQLPQGEYYFVETKAPNGFMPYGKNIEFEVSAGTDEELSVTAQVRNSKLLIFSTGGVGDVIFYIFGFITLLVYVALILFMIGSYKRNSKKQK